MGQKLLGITIIGVAIFLGYATMSGKLSFEEKKCESLTPAQQLTNLINQDFTELAKSHQLPPEWAKIGSVQYVIDSDLAKAFLGKRRPQIQRVKNGGYFLEMQFMDLNDNENPGFIIQASLIDIKSKNKIFEIGRTYFFEELNDPTPAKYH
jgi:hypothetical protein